MSYFRFKYFSLRQGFSALKFGTDAMVLGSFGNELLPSKGQFLDVGTGTGAIALMLCQKSPNRKVKGVEIDELTSLEACVNFSQVKFHQQLSLLNVDFFQWETDHLFDGIISNPPFYKNALQGNDLRVNKAKHAIHFSFDDFLFKSYMLTKVDGMLIYIIPFEDLDYHVSLSKKYNWFLKELIEIFSKDDNLVRCILVFSKSFVDCRTRSFRIRNSDNSYSNQYILLTKSFHNKQL